MTTPQTQARVRAILDQIVSDSLKITEAQLLAGGATLDEVAEAMAARRSRLAAWSAEALSGILAELSSAPTPAERMRALELRADDLEARVAVLERLVLDRASIN